jgi:hypothetical protein
MIFSEQGDARQALDYFNRTLQNLPESQAKEKRRSIAESTLDFLRRLVQNTRAPLSLSTVWHGGIRGGKVEANASTVDLRKVTRWDRLADLLSSDRSAGAVLSSEIPSGPTPLERYLEETGDSAAGAGAPLRSEKVGRNDPCPCGSGNKYQKCCLH